MSKFNINQCKGSPFCYGSTEAAAAPRSNPSCDSVQGESSGPSGGLPRLGEQHPEGTQPKASASAASSARSRNNLNFGWFTVPETKEGCPVHTNGRENLDNLTNSQPLAFRDGEQPANQGGTFDQKPPSRMSSRPGSNPPHNKSPYPPSRASHRSDSQSQEHLPVPQDMEMQPDPATAPDYQVSNHHAGPLYQLPPEGTWVEMDWPLSQAAQEQIARNQPAPQKAPYEESDHSRSASHIEKKMPPTPLPPLHWNGYRDQARPTYSSWQEDWHRRSGQAPPHDANFNNSVCTNLNNDTDNDHTNNINNNNGDNEPNVDDRALHASSDRPSDDDQNKLNDVSAGADGNNNNWTKLNRPSPQPRLRLSILPPYDLTRSTPEFYSPNVVMPWDDTDEQNSATPPWKDSNGQGSLMERLRAGIFSLLSLFSCLNTPTSPPAGQNVKLFKYNRFDKNDKPQQ